MTKGTIKFIEYDGQWEHATGTFQRYKVTFTDGKSYKFSSKGEFKKQVGEQVDYEVTNEQYNTAKLVYPKPQFQAAPQRNSDTQTQIVRQSMIKAAIDYHSKDVVSLDIIKQTARELIKFIETGE